MNTQDIRIVMIDFLSNELYDNALLEIQGTTNEIEINEIDLIDRLYQLENQPFSNDDLQAAMDYHNLLDYEIILLRSRCIDIIRKLLLSRIESV